MANTKPRRILRESLFNRDLSWLGFNDRVLGEAADPSVPPLERLRFAAIVSSNLDEFFMVRVAEIAKLARRFPNRRFPDGLSAAQVLAQIREHVLRQKARQAEVLEEILGALARHEIHIYSRLEAHRTLDSEIRRKLPEVKTVIRRSTESLPPIERGRLHVFVRFTGGYAIQTIQDRESRLLQLSPSARSRRFALLERWLCSQAAQLFPDREVIEAFPFRIISDADLRYRPDEEETLPEQIVKAVERRLRAKVVRLEVDAPTYTEGAMFLATALGLDSAALYRFDLPLDLRVLARIYGIKGYQRLRYTPARPMIPPPLRRGVRIFEVLQSRDVLLHHPYDSFDIVVNFLKKAALDPQVTRVYHSLYRTSTHSPVLEALKEAARRGKKVTAYVEVKARFDELNNIRSADELRRAGVRIVRPLGALKVHSKATQVFRQEGREERAYLHLGTGNYNPTTARQYTDLGLLTSDEALNGEIASYFQFLTQRRRMPAFRELLVAPGSLHQRILSHIRAETKFQQAGKKGHIIAKMNSLVDPDIIEALYDASRAGVEIELVVRGICCLRPGVKGLSENIRITSIIDRFLEHSRIYYFRAGGEEKIYLSSADWMPRNFYTRLEIAFPVKAPFLKRYIRDIILGHALADNVKSWTLQPDGTYRKSVEGLDASRVRSQSIFAALAKKFYRGTILERRLQGMGKAAESNDRGATS